MESSRKRGFFGSFFARREDATESPEPASSARASNAIDAGISLSPHPATFDAAPESPAKRASSAQLSTRKIIGRPTGPTSKLTNAVNASEFARVSNTMPKTTNFSSSSMNFTNGVSSTPKRLPGDNPYKTYSHSALSSATRGASFAASTPQNIFRASGAFDKPTFSFSPRVPPSTGKDSVRFPPVTPGKQARSSNAEINGRGMSHAGSTNLFTMRIPSPPPSLSGKRLSDEVPENAARTGSIYADEFLAHYCPPDFDDLQRRQFFCVLDLRRLKYAADEIFTKKDWKINVLNFAKEYEKSRSLIMLRYGLYEFKTVKASAAVKKQWQKEHGLPVSDDEDDEPDDLSPKPSPVARIMGPRAAGKRKAEEQLTKDTALTAASANANNKRRATDRDLTAEKNVSDSNVNKRKAHVEPDENQRSKQQKSVASPDKAPSSATKSLFERLANSSQSTSTTAATAKSTAQPASTPASNIFAKAVKAPNGTLGRSVLDPAAKPVSAANIFGHLSDASKDDADGESEDSADSEENSEVPEAGQSDEASVIASGGVATPQFSAGTLEGKKLETPNGASSTSSESGDGGKSRSLFERMTHGANSQPVALDSKTEALAQEPKSAEQNRATSPEKEQSAMPADKTWNANTPIKFAPSSAPSLFASTTSKPTPSFGAKDATSAPWSGTFGAPSSTLSGEDKPAPAKVDSSALSKTGAPSQPLFGFTPKPAQTDGATPSLLFGGSNKAPDVGTKLFGGPSTGFPAPKPSAEENKSTPASSAPVSGNLFAAQAKSVGPESSNPNSVFQSQTLFGGGPKAGDDKSTDAQPKPLFGFPAKAGESTTAAPQTSSIFAGASASNQTPGLFSSLAASSDPVASQPKEQSKPLFGLSAAQSTQSPFKSAADSSATPVSQNAKASEAKPLFGASSTPGAPTEQKPIFSGFNTSTSTPAASASRPLFGTASTVQGEDSKPSSTLFGNPKVTQPDAAKSGSTLFGNALAPPTSSAAPASASFTFGQSQNSAPGLSFGGETQQSTAPSVGSFGGGSSSFAFGAGGDDQNKINNPFQSTESTSAPSSFTTPNFNFTGAQSSDTRGGSPAPFQFGAGSSGAGEGAKASIFNFGGSGVSTPATQSNMFGNTAPQPNGASFIFGQQTLAPPGAGTSTGTNSPFTFGGASSLATTPATGTPEPGAENDAAASSAGGPSGTQADEGEEPQEQISLTSGGPGEEDESLLHEVRAKAVKLVMKGDEDSDSESAAKDKKNPWKVQGVGPLRVLKHKTTGAVRMLLRAEPRGHVALNRAVLPEFTYKPEPTQGKYVKITTAKDDGSGLETWMLQVKTKEAALALAEVLEGNKSANKK